MWLADALFANIPIVRKKFDVYDGWSLLAGSDFRISGNKGKNERIYTI